MARSIDLTKQLIVRLGRKLDRNATLRVLPSGQGSYAFLEIPLSWESHKLLAIGYGATNLSAMIQLLSNISKQLDPLQQ